MPTLNNVNVLFEEGSKKTDLIIVDCAGNKEATDVCTLILDMASKDWKDKTETATEALQKQIINKY
jgi:hypothetical protein